MGWFFFTLHLAKQLNWYIKLIYNKLNREMNVPKSVQSIK